MNFNWDAIGNFLKDQGPLLITLLYAYMNGKVIRAEQGVKNLELENQVRDAHAKIDAHFAGLSSTDVITSILNEVASPSGTTANTPTK